MSLGDELPVEPLEDERWLNIEDGVFAELDAGLSDAPPAPASAPRRRPHLLVGVVTATLAAAAALLLFVQLDSPTAVQHLSPQRIASGDGTMEASVGDAVARLSPRTAVSVVGDEVSGFVVIMERGEATFVVPPRGERPSFVVQAGPTRVEVVGTEFVVSYEASTAVTVAEGTVRVTHEGDSVLVGAGEHWTSNREPMLEPTPGASAETAEAPADEAETEAESGAEIETATPHRYDARARFEKASQLEPSAPARAIAIYAELARRGGAWAEVALYAQARAELERGNEDATRRLLRRYLRTYPDGENASDSRELLRRLQ